MSCLNHGVSNMVTVKRTLCNVDSLLTQSVKCLLDGDNHYQLTRDGLVYLRAIAEGKGWIEECILQHCTTFNDTFAHGSEEFLTYVKLWSECFYNLLIDDIPSSIIIHTAVDLISTSCQCVLDKLSTHIKDLYDTSQAPKTFTGNKPLARSKIKRFNKYSRHNIEESKTNLTEKKISECISSINNLVSEISENNILSDIISEVIQRKNRSEGRTDFGEVEFSTSLVNIEPVVRMNINKSSSHIGIALPFQDVYLIDIIKSSDSMKMILIDSECYGNNLPGTKIMKITEIVDFSEHCNEKDDSGFTFVDRLQSLGVTLVIWNGTINKHVRSQFAKVNIILMKCSRQKLTQLSHMCSCRISFCVNEFKMADIREVKIKLLYHVDSLNINRKRIQFKNNQSAFVLLTYNCHTVPIYQTIFLCSYTLDMFDLSFEALYKKLKKLELVFKNKKIIKNSRDATREMVTKLCNNIPVNDDSTQLKEVRPWLVKEKALYYKRIQTEVLFVFQTYLSLNKQDRVLAEMKYLSSLWNDSLACVIEIMNSKKYNLIIYIIVLCLYLKL